MKDTLKPKRNMQITTCHSAGKSAEAGSTAPRNRAPSDITKRSAREIAAERREPTCWSSDLRTDVSNDWIANGVCSGCYHEYKACNSGIHVELLKKRFSKSQLSSKYLLEPNGKYGVQTREESSSKKEHDRYQPHLRVARQSEYSLIWDAIMNVHVLINQIAAYMALCEHPRSLWS